MAIIFFDGFNRDFDDNHWSKTSETNVTFSGNVRSNSGPQCIHLQGDESLNYRLALSNIGTLSAKKFYTGFVINNFVLSSDDNLLYPNGRPLIRFYNSSNALVLDVTFKTLTSGTNTQVSYGTNVEINVVQNGAIVDTYVAGLWRDYAGARIVARDEWIYFEFELDLESVTNTFAMHINGVPLVNSGAAQKTNLTTIADLAKLEFIGGRGRPYYGSGTYIDDFYLVDNSGTRENTWLGPDTVVRNIDVQNGNFDSAVETDQWYSVGNYDRLYTDDGDTSGIRTSAFNQLQLYEWSNLSAGSFVPGTLIGGLRISTKAKNSSLDAAYRIVGKSALGTLYNLSDKYVMSDFTYKTRGPAYILNNPETNDRWSLAEINSFRFGVKSENPA